MKKVFIAIIFLAILVTGVYVYIRFTVLKSKDFKPDNTKSKSILDLRPALIAKLQQLVKDGSAGLYDLSIGKIEPHIHSGGVDIMAVTIVPDSVVLLKLKNAPDAPAEVFKISIDSFHIDGIGLEDLLHRHQVDLKTISITGPVIEMYRVKKLLNKKKKDTITLYRKLMTQVNRISIQEILVQHGIFINHNFGPKNLQVKLDDITVKMDSLLIDSSTQTDHKRFLFAESVLMSVKNLIERTEDSLYFIKCGAVDISTRENNISAEDVPVRPRYGKKEFENRLLSRKYMFAIDVPKITLSGIQWWSIVHGESIIAKRASMQNGKCDAYLDRSLPFRKIKPNNFPHQLLMRIPVPFSIATMEMRHMQLLYTEYNPGMGQAGSVVISNVNGTVTNITNIPAEIRKNRFMASTSSGSFMNHVPMDVGFRFDLSKYKTGNFSMDLKVGGMDSATLNQITGPLAEFIFKRGSIQKGIAHVEGNNLRATGRGILLYKNLYLESLKKSSDKPGKIKERKLLSFIGNVLLIKNSNPSNGKAPRRETFDSERNDHQPFFSLVWKTIFIGVLKSIGLPRRFADKPY